MATSTNMPITTSTQDETTSAMKTVSALAMTDGMARVRNTVLATKRRCDLGTDNSRTMSKQTQTTTMACPMDSRICPGMEPLKAVTASIPGLTAGPCCYELC